MTSFVDDNGNYLDYSGEDFGVTKQVASWYDFKITGDYSITFKIPNTSPNRRTLGYYGAQQISSPAFSSIPFNLIKDGSLISRGFIVITSSDVDINCFFISGNSNWFQLFAFNIKDTQFQDRFTVLLSDLDGQKAEDEGIVFPLIDWYASGARRSTNYVKINRSSNPESGPEMTEVHPCLFLHTIVSEMATYSGVKIAGTLMDDPLYKKIIFTPEGPDYYIPDTIVNRSYARIQNGPFGSAGAGLYDYTLDPQLVRFQTIVEGQGQVDTTLYAWYAPYTGTYRMDIDFWFNNVDTYTVQMYVNDVLYTTLFNQAISTRNKVGTAFANLVKGDKVTFYVSNLAAANYRLDYLTDSKYTNISIKLEKFQSVTPTANLGTYSPIDTVPYILPNSIVPDMKAVDLVKFLACYFGCSVSYNEFSKTLSLNKISSFDKREAEDWSEFVVSTKTIYDTKVAANNYIQTPDTEEDDIIAYNKQSNLKYGGGNITTFVDEDSINKEEEKTLYTIPFPGSWDVRNKSYSKVFYPFIKFYDLEQVESVTYSAVADASGFARFTSTFTDKFGEFDVFYVISTSGIYSGFAPFLTSSTDVTNPVLLIDYSANDSGTIIKYKATKVQGKNRMLLCSPSKALTEIGLAELTPYVGSNPGTTITTGPLAWYDKPVLDLGIDVYLDSLAVDSINGIGTGEKYYNEIKNIFNRPKIEAFMRIPVDVFYGFDFTKFVYLRTGELNGYFFVNKIENYKDPLNPVKVELLYVE